MQEVGGFRLDMGDQSIGFLISCSIVYGILFSTTADPALARTPLEQRDSRRASSPRDVPSPRAVGAVKAVSTGTSGACLFGAWEGLAMRSHFCRCFPFSELYSLICHETKAHRLGCCRHTLHIGTIQPPPVLLPEG